jgi:N-acetylglucosaminyl-diphospho-decaprenol L-rhamnosyltransferase
MSAPTRAPLDATVVIVNYNDGPRLGPLLDLLREEVRRVVVVDNASSDGSERAAAERPEVTLIRNEQNRGYAPAANQGAAQAEGAWLVLVNPDAHLQRGDIEALMTDLPSDVAAVAPVQVDRTGAPRPETGGYAPTLLRYLLWAFVPVRFHGRWGPWLATIPSGGDVALDWVSSALLVIRRDAFEAVGGLDERFFLYHEDVDFGRRLRARGWRVLCRTSVTLFHEVATGNPERRLRQSLLALDSLALEFEGWRRPILGAILAVGFGLRALMDSPPERALARAALPASGRMIVGRQPSATDVARRVS